MCSAMAHVVTQFYVYPQVEWTITSQTQSFTAFWRVLISHPAEGRRLSWPEWLITYRDGILTYQNGHPSQY